MPQSAVQTNGTEHYVLVEAAATSRASEFVKRNVHLGRQGGGWAEILGGEIYQGDRVVTTGAHVLANFFVQGVLRLSPEAKLNMGLQVAPAEMRPIDHIVEVDGALDLPPEKRAVASSQLAGTIENILIDRGQTVSAGEAIAEVERRISGDAAAAAPSALRSQFFVRSTGSISPAANQQDRLPKPDPAGRGKL